MYKLELAAKPGMGFPYCYTWWQNFYGNILSEWKEKYPPSLVDEPVDNCILTDMYNKALEEAGCKMIKESGEISYLLFETAEDAMMFKMRWS